MKRYQHHNVKKGDIVESTYGDVKHDPPYFEVGDLGFVTSVSSSSEFFKVEFGSCKVILKADDFIPSNLCRNQFVCMRVVHHSSSPTLKKGDIGCIIGILHNRLIVCFGNGKNDFRLLSEVCSAPAPWTKIGDQVYSTINFAHFQKGDIGVLVGPSTSHRCADRVAVRFGNVPTTFNLGATMVSLTEPKPPTRQAESMISLRTEDVTLISHAHGRQRRSERGVLRRELQAAIKYGVREQANPGRDGSRRWRYTYDGVVYITDETSRHEVTSWRIDGDDKEDAMAPPEIELAGKGCHAVLIVDHSGSMRSSDVPGYESRARAVYECLIRDFVKEQIKTGAAEDVVVTLIAMSNQATVLIDKHPLNESLVSKLEKIKTCNPHSHGNYIPALDKALEVMTADAPNRSSLLLLLFSDGAPSDHATMKCEHGIPIFQLDRRADPLMQHSTKGSAWSCRSSVQNLVKKNCLDRIKKIGQIFGRDKVILRTVAYGPPNEDFRMLEEMANALPRGECQKLGLNVHGLKTAFSSLSSSMTELRTEGGGRLLTPRRDKVVDKEQGQKVDLSANIIDGRHGWLIYAFEDFMGKYEYDRKSRELKACHISKQVTGLAFLEQPFAEGAERFVYRCTEINIPEEKADEWYRLGVNQRRKNSTKSFRCGLRLVAKEAKDMENLRRGLKFHSVFARVQTDAAALAVDFSKKLPPRHPEWNVSFLHTTIYGCFDDSYADEEAWVLVEPELEGKFTKWNNNAGAVRGQVTTRQPASSSAGGVALGIGSLALVEEDEEEDEDEENHSAIEIDEVPQAFSHFTYEHSNGRKLVCDLQGVWNPDDGFVLTDPVVHYVSTQAGRHKNGATDKGLEGVKRFFGTHVCGPLCRKMGLASRTPNDLILIPSSQLRTKR